MEEETLISQPKKVKKDIFLWFAFFVLILVVGTTVVLATRIWDPFWNPFRPNPEEVIKRMFLKMEEIKTFEEKGEFFAGIKTEEGELDLKISGGSKKDLTEKEKPKEEAVFEIVFSVDQEESLTVEFTLNGEIKAIGETLYLKITNFPNFPEVFPEEFDLSLIEDQIEDQWIKIDEQSLLNLLEKFGMGIPEIEERIRKEKEFQKQFEEDVKKFLKEKPWLSVKKQFPDKKIGKIEVYHYLLNLDIQLVSDFFLEKIKEMIEKGMVFNSTFNEIEFENEFEEEFNEFRKKLKESLNKIGEVNVELWIGKKDYFLYKIKGEKTFNLSQFEEEMEGEISLGLNLEYSKFNQPVKIEPPTEYKELEEILTPFIEMYLKELERRQLYAFDTKIIMKMNELRSISVILEVEENSYRNLCKHGLLNKNHPSFGEELKGIENAIREVLGENFNLSCYSAKDSYCVVVDLISPDKGKFCIDSSLIAKEIREDLNCVGRGTPANPYRCPEE